MVLRTPRGLMVITGCAHPGITYIVRKAKEVGKVKVHLVLGGFHLGGASTSALETIIEDFIELGVGRVAPCHCSGDLARSLFKEHFGLNYIEYGVGKNSNRVPIYVQRRHRQGIIHSYLRFRYIDTAHK